MDSQRFRQALGRRRLLGTLAGLGLLSAGVGTGVFLLAEDRSRSSGPALRMPFPAGTVVLCEQGNLSPAGQTHSLQNNLFAIDFSNLVLDEVTVVSAAAGRVVRAISGSGVDDPEAGAEYGNQVLVDHGQDWFSFYSHLDRVDVRSGDSVASGAPLGTMGRTGLAGSRHLHFCLTRSGFSEPGVAGSAPIRALTALDVTAREEAFAPRAGNAFVDDSARPWAGHLYASENSPARAVLNAAPAAELRAEIERGHKALAAALERRLVLADVARDHERHDVGWSRERVERVLDDDPDDPVARYYLAVAVLVRERKFQDAERELSRAKKHALVPRRFEPWLGSWLEAELGVCAAEQGRADEARAAFGRALLGAKSEQIRELARRYSK